MSDTDDSITPLKTKVEEPKPAEKREKKRKTVAKSDVEEEPKSTPDISVKGITAQLQIISEYCSNSKDKLSVLLGCVMLLCAAQPNYIFRTRGMGGTNIFKMEIFRRNKEIPFLPDGEMLDSVTIEL